MVDITDTITDAFAEKYELEKYAKGINAFVKAQVQFLTEFVEVSKWVLWESLLLNANANITN
ncbi:MAG: hypothetical protein IK065_04045 [Neisseriaceae bacterium]|nr:hypothetical protein [Neisseriaceae bacterium]